MNNIVYKILFRHLLLFKLSKKVRPQGAITSLLPFIGVAVGVTAFILVTSIMAGMVAKQKEKLVSIIPHLELVPANKEELLEQNVEILKKIKTLSSDIVSVSPFIKTNVAVEGNNIPQLVKLNAIEINNNKYNHSLNNYIINGDISFLEQEFNSNNNQVNKFPVAIISYTLASRLKINLRDTIIIISTENENMETDIPKQIPFVVGAFFDVSSLYDNTIFISLQNAKKLLNYDKEISGYEIKLKNPFEYNEIQTKINNIFDNKKYQCLSWVDKNKVLMSAFELEKVGMSLVMFMIILVGCFAITISLILSIKRRKREIAILRSLGLSYHKTGYIYLLHGTIVGIIGVIVGLLVGFFLLWILTNTYLGQLLGKIYFGNTLPVIINIKDVVFISIGSILCAIFASIWPAKEAMEISVIENLNDL